jgi:hypothetical protein
MEFSVPRPATAEPPVRLYIPVKAGMLKELTVGKKATFRVTGEVVELGLREFDGKTRYEVGLEVSRVQSDEGNEFSRMAEEEGT